MTGRSNFNRYASYLSNNNYLRAAILRDPFEELAERLLFAKFISKTEAGHTFAQYGTGLGPLIDFSRDLVFTDQKALLSSFRKAKKEEREAMTSPMVRMLGCDVDEPPERRNVSIALENLASMDVVGTRARYDAFRFLLTRMLSANILGDEEPMAFPAIGDLAEILSRIGVAADLLEHDLALYSFADEAIGIGLEGGGEIARDTQTI